MDTGNNKTNIDEELDFINSLPCFYPTCAECPFVGENGECSGDILDEED